MDPRTGRIYELSGEGDGDPPAIGATIGADAVLRNELLADRAGVEADPEAMTRLEEMAERRERLVAVDESVVQKLRLGEKELRRRKQRRR